MLPIFSKVKKSRDEILMLLFTECPSTTGKSSMHDVHIINLSLPHEIKILADKKEAISPPSSLNITRVSSYEITQYISIGQKTKRQIYQINKTS